jgi:hypothetical protein
LLFYALRLLITLNNQISQTHRSRRRPPSPPESTGSQVRSPPLASSTSASSSLDLHAATDVPAPTPPPTLIAQCTLRPNGKSYFELFANFGGAADLSFYPPWTQTSQQDLFPPRTEKVALTTDFIGYTHVKPIRRQLEIPVQTPGQYRYNPPGSGSSNLEEITYYLRYLLALPTLRLTLNNTSVDFQTAPLLNEIRKEPLCHAAAL